MVLGSSERTDSSKLSVAWLFCSSFGVHLKRFVMSSTENHTIRDQAINVFFHVLIITKD